MQQHQQKRKKKRKWIERENQRETEHKKKEKPKGTWEYIIIKDSSAYWEGGRGKRPAGYDNVSLLASAVRE